MKYIRENYKFTYASDQWFRKEIRKWAATKGNHHDENTKPTGTASQTKFLPSKSYYRIINGEHYVRSLLDAADLRLEGKGNGLISEEYFKQIIEISRDGKGITEAEMRTLEYIGLKYNLTTKARLWFEENIEKIRSEMIKSEQSSDEDLSQEINKEEETVIESEEPSDEDLPQAVNKEQETVIASNVYGNKKTTTEHVRPVMNENHHKSLFLVNVFWAILLLISIITVRSIFIDQVADADQNLEKLLSATQNNTLLQEQLNKILIEKNQLESELKGLDQNMSDQLIQQKKLEEALSLEKSQANKQTMPEVIVFKPDQNNCCFCSCGNRGFEESLQNY